MFFFDGTHYWAGYVAIWGDWSTHIAYILNFANRGFVLPFNPQYLGEPFRYHFAADQISALLLNIGFTLVQATIFPSIVCHIALIYVVYAFFLSVFKRKLIAMISSVLFFFNGGFGVYFETYGSLLSQITGNEYTHLATLTRSDDYGYRWMNFFLAEFVPQRAFLLGAPITIYLLTHMWHIYENGVRTVTKKRMFIWGIVAGLLPIIQFHSYYVVLAVSVFVFAVSLRDNRRNFSRWVCFFLPLVGISWALISNIFGGLPEGSIRLQLGGIGPHEFFPLVWFWFINLGIMAILIPYSYMKATPRVRLFYVPFIFFFLLANTVLFQNDDWNNRRFLIYWYLFSAGLVGNLLTSLIRRKQVLISCLIFSVAILSGVIDSASLLNTQRQSNKWFSSKDLDFSKQIMTMTSPDAIFLTAPADTFSTITLGRQIVMGWDGWLQNYGKDSQQRKNDIRLIYENIGESNVYLQRYTIDYIIVGEIERRMYNINSDIFDERFSVLLKNDKTTVYDVRKVWKY